tara:strand:+ start:4212 stop:4982 length:771 start_codon:yes stop_codon:yes gene_type:complete
MFQYLKIYDLNQKKIRIGPKKDGGYILLDQISKNTDNLFSFGVEDNIDFEIDFYSKYKPKNIILYDHTVDKLPKKTNFKFVKKGLSHKKTKKFISLDDLKIKQDTNNILKMDIEYDEWSVFEKISLETLMKFKQIICEFHFFFLNPDNLDHENLSPYFTNFSKDNYKKINQLLRLRYEKVLKKLTNHFTIFHLSANNSLPLKKMFNFKFPQLIELSLVRNDMIKEKKFFKGKIPINNLDFPNKSYKQDLTNFYPFI